MNKKMHSIYPLSLWGEAGFRKATLCAAAAPFACKQMAGAQSGAGVRGEASARLEQAIRENLARLGYGG